jgi:hypothetical protein
VFFNTPGEPGGYVAEVWTMNADGSDQQRLYRSGCCIGAWAAPIWSPDGRRKRPQATQREHARLRPFHFVLAAGGGRRSLLGQPSAREVRQHVERLSG